VLGGRCGDPTAAFDFRLGAIAIVAKRLRLIAVLLKPPRLILIIDIGKLLPAAVLHDKAGFQFIDGPGRREAARKQFSGPRTKCEELCRTSHLYGMTKAKKQ
jgi:hypothetical protein